MKQTQQRITIFPTDVEFLTGKSNRSARRLLNDIRKAHNKEPHQLISYCELAAHLGLKPEVVFKSINNMPLQDEEE